jgi:hypothetical protein
MLLTKILPLFLAFFLLPHWSLADDGKNLVGNWKIVSYQMEFQSTGEKVEPRGKNPTGYINFTPEGWMGVIITDEGRKPATIDQDRADLFKALVAYTGPYRIEGDKWIVKVEVAHNPAWVGTEQARSFKIEGNRLQEITQLMPYPPLPEKGMVRYIITYEKMK